MALGFNVIPLNAWDVVKKAEGQPDKPMGKLPAIPGWKAYQDRKATDAELREWFDRGPGPKRNLAVVCGTISGLVVVDADSEEAVQWVRANLPATPWEVSTGKGVHFYYRHPEGKIGNRARIKGTALDVRGDGGYVVAPGSIHPSGRPYLATGDWAPTDEVPILDPALIQDEAPAIPPAPPARERATWAKGEPASGWALDQVERAWRFMKSVPTRKAGEGRNEARFKLACALVRGFNLPDDEALKALSDWNARCPGGVTESELWTSIKNAHASGGEAYGARLAEAPREPLRRAGGTGGGSAPRPPKSEPLTEEDGPFEPPSFEGPDMEWPEDEDPVGLGCPWDGWTDPLIVHKGEPRRWAGNLAKILRQDKRWGRRLSLNEMSQRVMFDAKGDGHPVAIPEHFADLVQEQIENIYGLSFSRDEVDNKIRAQAVENPYHPVRRYLQELPKWDGIERIEFIPREVLGTDDPMAPLFMRRFCIGAVRRAMEPGCKLDVAVVLVGEQGKRKSTFWRTLTGSEFFSDTPVELDSKDRFFQVNAAWVVEMAEIDGMNSTATAESVKAFLSSQKDTFRPPYARTPITLYRSSVCVGTTNKEEFLHDVTGSRRFWPIPIDLGEDEEINLELLDTWRDQVWAEAMAYWEAGEPHWLTRDEEARRVACSARYEAEDAWAGILDRALKDLKKERLFKHSPPPGPQIMSAAVAPAEPPPKLSDGWPIGEILLKVGVPVAQHTKSMTQRAAGLLRKRGWVRQYLTVGKDRRWRWYDPTDLERELEAC